MEFVNTADGSKTLFHELIGEHYHSKHGALQESKHVFLKTGLQHWLEKEDQKEVSILEIGFGTGLNFLLTADYASQNKLNINYVGIEAYPLDSSLIFNSGYDQYLETSIWNNFITHYKEALKHSVAFNECVQLEIAHTQLLNFNSENKFDVVYFDAFAEIHQPEMWNEEALAHVSKFLKPKGVFVTYAITGNLKRTMKSLGFTIEKAPGAPGKREMLRATKI